MIKESAQIALTWVRSNAISLGITRNAGRNVLENVDVHIHFPAGAIPKDGPSAGVAIITALISLFRGIPVQPQTAMTGEVTLRGQVLPVGGIKEKVLAAHRAGIKKVIMPHRNEKDLADIPQNVRDDITFVLAKTIWDVLDAGFAEGWKVKIVEKSGADKEGEVRKDGGISLVRVGQAGIGDAMLRSKL